MGPAWGAHETRAESRVYLASRFEWCQGRRDDMLGVPVPGAMVRAPAVDIRVTRGGHAVPIARCLASRRYAASAFALIAFLLGSCGRKSTPTGPVTAPDLETVSGTVRFADGRPAPDIPVSIARRLIPPPAAADTFFSQLAFSDSAGHFGFTAVPKGTFSVFAFLDDGSFSFPPVDSLVAAAT